MILVLNQFSNSTDFQIVLYFLLAPKSILCEDPCKWYFQLSRSQSSPETHIFHILRLAPRWNILGEMHCTLFWNTHLLGKREKKARGMNAWLCMDCILFYWAIHSIVQTPLHKIKSWRHEQCQFCTSPVSFESKQ